MKRLTMCLLGLGLVTAATGCCSRRTCCSPTGCGVGGGGATYGTPYGTVPGGGYYTPSTTQAVYPVTASAAAPAAPYSGYPVTAMGPLESLPTY